MLSKVASKLPFRKGTKVYQTKIPCCRSVSVTWFLLQPFEKNNLWLVTMLWNSYSCWSVGRKLGLDPCSQADQTGAHLMSQPCVVKLSVYSSLHDVLPSKSANVDLKQSDSGPRWIAASLSTFFFSLPSVLVNSSPLSLTSWCFPFSRLKKKMIKQGRTYLPGQTDGSQALPAWWHTLPAGTCAHTCTPPCLWSAAAPASSGTGSCSGRLSAASSHCSHTRREEEWLLLWKWVDLMNVVDTLVRFML